MPDDTPTPHQITVWRDGRFQSQQEPGWWTLAVMELWSGPGGRRREGALAIDRAGDLDFRHVLVFRLDDGEKAPKGASGYVVEFWTVDGSEENVWAPTAADYLDLMTTRVPAWLRLETLTDELEATKARIRKEIGDA